MGRKSLRDEALQMNVINLSWFTISRALNSKDIPDKEKRAMCMEIVKKSCPKEINLKGEAIANNVYNIISRVQRDFKEHSRTPLALVPGDGVDKG